MSCSYARRPTIGFYADRSTRFPTGRRANTSRLRSKAELVRQRARLGQGYLNSKGKLWGCISTFSSLNAVVISITYKQKASCQSASTSHGPFLSASKIPGTTDAWIFFREQMVATGSRNFGGTSKIAGNGRPYITIRALPMFRQPMLWTLPNDVYLGWSTSSLRSQN
jgi:hypothetical protein